MTSLVIPALFTTVASFGLVRLRALRTHFAPRAPRSRRAPSRRRCGPDTRRRRSRAHASPFLYLSQLSGIYKLATGTGKKPGF